jgi:hypothetical protein
MLRKLDLLHPETAAQNGVSSEEKEPWRGGDLAGYVSIATPKERKGEPKVPEAPDSEEQSGTDQRE